jgi:hypothetical protein
MIPSDWSVVKESLDPLSKWGISPAFASWDAHNYFIKKFEYHVYNSWVT